ncbi:MAG: GTPase ObgE [Dehalococcoidia bacterium]|nr:GTPase ObgE [Dehalococcoidia bacterium]
MIDRALVRVKDGDGGDGAVSFRREKFVPRGGPDGGDGGNGASVVLRVDPSLNSLLSFRRQRVVRAESGVNGEGGKRHGKRGVDLIVAVPPGTEVYRREGESDVRIADLDGPGMAVVVASGGRGGRGNARFASSTNQVPRFAQRGEPGEEFELRLELKLLADIGLVGAPNAGKSTLLAAISAATPKIADYPFTTLEPQLGVVEVNYDTFVAADIPGLIEGASTGAGLGHEFLRHIERTRLLIHVVGLDVADPLATFDQINGELTAFNRGLEAKNQVVALNKIDLPDVETKRREVEAAFRQRGLTTFSISAAGRQMLEPLLRHVFGLLGELREEERRKAGDEPALPVLRPEPERQRFEVRREGGVFVVEGRRPVLLVETMDLENPEARAEVQRRLTVTGVSTALRRAGALPGDRVRFGRVELRWDA